MKGREAQWAAGRPVQPPSGAQEIQRGALRPPPQEAGLQCPWINFLALPTWTEYILALATGRSFEGICVLSPAEVKYIVLFTWRRRGRVKQEKEEEKRKDGEEREGEEEEE